VGEHERLSAAGEALDAGVLDSSQKKPFRICTIQGYLAHKKTPPPRDVRRAPGIGLL